jgi:hypothetical protein
MKELDELVVLVRLLLSILRSFLQYPERGVGRYVLLGGV